MIVKVENNGFVQKCVCGKLYQRAYSSYSIAASFITLTPCEDCGSLEVLHSNNGDDEHSVMVAKVFVKIATQG